jgi:hypothetical protein
VILVATVAFVDQTATGRELARFEVVDLPDTVSVRELIRLRVRDEVARYNAAPAAYFTGLVRPLDAEADVNGYRMRQVHLLDWVAQADTAVAAFARNGFFVLMGDRQLEDLDEEVDLSSANDVAFVKLVQLVGG